MKKISTGAIVFCLVILFNTPAFSQVTYGIFGGPQLTTAKYKVEDEHQPTEFKIGAQLGATMKIPFDNRLYFGPAVYYSLKGYKVKLNKPSFPPAEAAINNEVTLHTLELAPLLHLDFSNQPNHFFVKFGPAIDIAFSGTEKFDTLGGTALGGTAPIERSMRFAFTEYGRFTAQAIVHFGYETEKGLFAFAHYAEGLGGLNNADDGPVIKHRIIGFSVGWFFNRNRNIIDTRVKE